MTIWKFALHSLCFYLRTNMAIALGVAAATAVLTGALIVGDSMRHSLRELTLERLGDIDEMLVSDGFFRQQLADEITQTDVFREHYDKVSAAIMFPGGTVESKPAAIARRAARVTVLGIDGSFGGFNSKGATAFETLVGETAVINQTLADDLKISAEDVESGIALITVRIPKQTQLPADSALGRKTDLIESLVNLKVIQIIPTEGLGRFGMFPSQTDPLNVFIPIELLQESLKRTVLKHKSDPAQANVLLISAKGDLPPATDVTAALRNELRPTLEDYGLKLGRVAQIFGEPESSRTVFEYWSLSSDRLVLTDETVDSIVNAIPDATPVFTYLANDLRRSDETSGIPFSMISAIDFGDSFAPRSAVSGKLIRPLGDNEMVLNRWAADDLGAEIGSVISTTFYEPESTHGSQMERTVEMKVVDVAELTAPDQPFVFRRGRGLTPAVFVQEPAVANDPDLTPTVPGLTDASSIENWDLPFSTDGKLRPQDDDYWDYYRTTPKAFVSLATGQRLWRSRFGSVTSFRIPIAAGTENEIQNRLLNQFAADQATLGMRLVAIKRRGLEASSPATPFDYLFLALSMFVIGAALILVSLLFRLGLQQRATEIGLLKAVGFEQKKIRKLWLSEMLIVAMAGSVIGVILGIGYAWSMIWGLSTWWVGAISRPFLTLHVAPLSLVAGLISGLVICVLTIAWSLWRTRNLPVQCLLSGTLELSDSANPRQRMIGKWIAVGLIVVALGLAVMAAQLSGMAQAGAFMGAGFLILVALLMLVYRWLEKSSDPQSEGRLSLARLAMLNAKRNPLRSTLTIGLVAVASFLIAAVSSFRLTPTETGTAGFDWVALSSQPVFDDLSTLEGQTAALGVDHRLSAGTDVMAIRYKSGEDASCNNLYQATQPRALGVPKRFIRDFDSDSTGHFSWVGSLATTEAEKQNPWRLLDSETAHAGTEEDPIPVVLDKNTATYSLKILFPGTVRKVEYDSGETIFFRAVGFLEDSILQGSLIMSETDFVAAFPASAGYQFFLIRDGEVDSLDGRSNVDVLEDRLSDQGFDARPADQLLSEFMAVQNTYLSTFQTLGALGLLLGTFGLAAVEIRSVMERKKELGLMRAVGFGQQNLSAMVLMENAWLLLVGLGVGISAALFTTVPHWLVGTASAPWLALLAMFGGIVAAGLISGWFASRIISKMPLLESLRA